MTYLLRIFDLNHRRLRHHPADGDYDDKQKLIDAIAHALDDEEVGTCFVQRGDK